jgi:hypothetical protein
MKRDRPGYYDDIREANRAGRAVGARIILPWLAAFVVLAVLIGGGTWAFKVLTSDVKGAGDQTRQVNSGNNRIFAQEQFAELFNKIKGYDRQLDQAAANLAARPNDPTFITNYTGLKNVCVDATAQYNANAKKVTQAKWRDAELPYQIDESDPTTDCQESK